jgi:hypothetical protein
VGDLATTGGPHIDRDALPEKREDADFSGKFRFAGD